MRETRLEALLGRNTHYQWIFKLVEALLQIYSCFFSHSIKLYVAYRYQQCHCLAAFPAKMSVFNSHMQGSRSMISNKPRLHTKKNIFIQ